jgi:hypothetical protein
MVAFTLLVAALITDTVPKPLVSAVATNTLLPSGVTATPKD